MNHPESEMQRQCVALFRSQYPQYAMLLIHPINEGSGHAAIDRRRQGIHKAEGAVAGVSDLLLFMPCCLDRLYYGAAFELKTPSGRQSQEQKYWQKILEAAGYKYFIIRSLDEFRKIANSWIAGTSITRRQSITAAHVEIVKDRENREKELFFKIVNKK